MTTDKFALLENQLRQTWEDQRLSKTEKYALQDLAVVCSDEERRFLLNRSFEIVRDHIGQNAEAMSAFLWLERVIKALQPVEQQVAEPVAFFSPGEACRNSILQQLHVARNSADICVFTISDNVISEAILKAHQRGLAIRIITDNEKSHDRGSDIFYLAQQGLAIREDVGPDHMHHKFAVFDKKALLNGSFNWTRSATESNYENLTVNHHPALVQSYQQKFEQLWQTFPDYQF